MPCSSHHDVGKGNVNVLHHLQSIAEMALALSFSYTDRYNFIQIT